MKMENKDINTTPQMVNEPLAGYNTASVMQDRVIDAVRMIDDTDVLCKCMDILSQYLEVLDVKSVISESLSDIRHGRVFTEEEIEKEEIEEMPWLLK